MHTSSVLLFALTTLSASVSAATCNLASLVPLLVDERNDACQTASGIVFPPPPGTAPTADQWQKTCNVKACTTLYADLLTATTSECSIGKFAAHADLVNQHRKACGLALADANTTTPSTSSSSSSSSSAQDNTVTSPDLITQPPVTAAPSTAPTPPTTPPKRNSTTAVEALTSSAPMITSASTFVMATTVVVATMATFVL